MALSSNTSWVDALRDKWYHPVISSEPDTFTGFSPTTVIVDEFGITPRPVFKIENKAASALERVTTTTQQATVAAKDLGERLRDMIEFERVLEERGTSVSEIMQGVMGFKLDEMRIIDAAMERVDRERAEKERAELEKIPGFGMF